MAAIWRIQRVRSGLRRTRPQDERAEVDRHACGPDLRFALPVTSLRGSLWGRGLQGEVCEGLRGGVDQGDEQRSVRPRLRPAEEENGEERGGLRGSPRLLL